MKTDINTTKNHRGTWTELIFTQLYYAILMCIPFLIIIGLVAFPTIFYLIVLYLIFRFIKGFASHF